MSLVLKSAVASLAVQFIVGGITLAGFFLDIPDYKRNDITVILSLEFSSQVIEFLWYIVTVIRYSEIQTWTRYLDWTASTPVMLISTALFFQHRYEKDLSAIFLDWPIYACLAFNWIMLAFGFAAETNFMPRTPALFLGSFAFVGTFTCLAVPILESDGLSIQLFWTMYTVWGLYGVAAAFPYKPKNVAYNLLDLVSKNFYGIFLFVYSLT